MRRIFVIGLVCVAACLVPAVAQASTVYGAHGKHALVTKPPTNPGAPFVFCRETACPFTGWYVDGTSVSDVNGNTGKIQHFGKLYWVTFAEEKCTFYWYKTQTGLNSEEEPGPYVCEEEAIESTTSDKATSDTEFVECWWAINLNWGKFPESIL